MNKTAIALAIIALVMLESVAVVAVAIYSPDILFTVIAFFGSSLTTLITAIVIIYNLSKTNEKVDKIEKQTNGMNTALLSAVTGHSEDTIERYKGNHYNEKEN